jgi:hypothetical protein
MTALPPANNRVPVSAPTDFGTVQFPVHCNRTIAQPMAAPLSPEMMMPTNASARAPTLGSDDNPVDGVLLGRGVPRAICTRGYRRTRESRVVRVMVFRKQIAVDTCLRWNHAKSVSFLTLFCRQLNRSDLLSRSISLVTTFFC